MSIHEILFDGVFGDISLSWENGVVDCLAYEDHEEYLSNTVRGRLKTTDQDQDSAKKYNLFGLIGNGNNSSMENIATTTVFNMLTYDGLIDQKALEVIALRKKHTMNIGIRARSTGSTSDSRLEIMITRDDNGKIY